MPNRRVTPRAWEPKLTIKCRFCGGTACRRCSRQAALAQKDSPIKGLHCNWVTRQILGMMRPSSKLIQEFSLLSRFEDENIKAVFNLTMPGEHPHCGYGNLKSGFPYDPEEFMAKGIAFYNFGWEDMTTPELPYMLNIVKVMSSILQNPKHKISVHCHAGYGRTGLAIACTLMSMHRLMPNEAVDIVRKGRPGSIQTAKQLAFVTRFYQFLHVNKVQFSIPTVHDKFTIDEAISRQSKLLQGTEAHKYHLVLKLVAVLCGHIRQSVLVDPDLVALSLVGHVACSSRLSSSEGSPIKTQLQLLLGDGFKEHFYTDFVVLSEDLITEVKIALNNGNWEILEAFLFKYPTLACALLLDWIEQLAAPMVSYEAVEHWVQCCKSASTNSGSTDNGSQWSRLNENSVGSLRNLQLIFETLNCITRASNPAFQTAVGSRVSSALCHLSLKEYDSRSRLQYDNFVMMTAGVWKAPRPLKMNVRTIHTEISVSTSEFELNVPITPPAGKFPKQHILPPLKSCVSSPNMTGNKLPQLVPRYGANE